MLVQVDRLASALQRFDNMPEPVAMQGSVCRSGEAVLLSLDAGNERGSAGTAREE